MATTFVIVKTIVVNQHDEVLILKRGVTAPRRPGAWDLPGGFVELNEDISQTAIREVLEETGIALKQVSLLYAISDYEQEISAGGNWLIFVARTNGSDYKISWEHDEAKWVPVDDLDVHIIEGRQAAGVKYIVAHQLIRAQHDTYPK